MTLKTTGRQFLLMALVSSVLMTVTAIVYFNLTDLGVETLEEKRIELKSLIQGYIADGILLRVDQEAKLPRVYVTPEFGILTVSEKQVILEVVLDYFQLENEEIQSIDIFESQFQNPIGHYDGHVLLMN